MKKYLFGKCLWLVVGWFMIAGLYSCKPLIALYDQYAYTQAVSIKVDLQNLIQSSATINYEDDSLNISNINTELQKAYEYAKGRSENSISTAQYALLLSKDGFYKNFLTTWKSQGKESSVAANEMSIKIGQLVDQIIKLENGKNKSTSN